MTSLDDIYLKQVSSICLVADETGNKKGDASEKEQDYDEEDIDDEEDEEDEYDNEEYILFRYHIALQPLRSSSAICTRSLHNRYTLLFLALTHLQRNKR